MSRYRKVKTRLDNNLERKAVGMYEIEDDKC